MAANDTAKAAPQLHPCGCGCGQQVKSAYAQGHDARHVSQLRKAYESGSMTRAKALAAVKSRPKLVAKLARSLDLVDEARTKAKEAAKAAAKPATDKPKPPRARASASKKADPEPPPADDPDFHDRILAGGEPQPPADEAA